MRSEWLQRPIRSFHREMKHFFIIANEQKDKNLEVTKKIQEYIHIKGGTCTYGRNRLLGQAGYENLNPREIPENTECVFCIGGDGTLIRAARDVVDMQLPLIGVNRGHVGYLCELDDHTVFPAIDQLMTDHYMVEERMLLTGYSIKNGKKLTSLPALNDVVIHRSGMLQLVNLIIYVNGEYLNTYSADGIIIATPTGSTGYSMSAGGPIVDPKAELILITPISPHSLNSKSIVIGAEDEIMVEIGSRRMEADERVEVSFDGDHSVELTVGDRVVAGRAGANAHILKLSRLSFLEILRKKMQEYT